MKASAKKKLIEHTRNMAVWSEEAVKDTQAAVDRGDIAPWTGARNVKDYQANKALYEAAAAVYEGLEVTEDDI